MNGITLDGLESAIVELVSRKSGLLWSDDVCLQLSYMGWESFVVTKAIIKLVNQKILTLNEKNRLCFTFPEDNGADVSGLAQIQQIFPSTPGDSNQREHDPVNSPSHYTRGGIEAIDFIEAKGLGFCLGNVVKYVSRAGFKADAKIQDLEKAQWYLTREINRMKKAQ